jgi:hypothetical protein
MRNAMTMNPSPFRRLDEVIARGRRHRQGDIAWLAASMLTLGGLVAAILSIA